MGSQLSPFIINPGGDREPDYRKAGVIQLKIKRPLKYLNLSQMLPGEKLSKQKLKNISRKY